MSVLKIVSITLLNIIIGYCHRYILQSKRIRIYRIIDIIVILQLAIDRTNQKARLLILRHNVHNVDTFDIVIDRPT